MAKVSIIVPIYNMEKYLPKCLDSLITQTYKDIEILAISDGSTDKSVSIVKKYQKKDKRIKLIEKENGGYGSVLEYAINRLIKTKYFLICDPDDYLDKSCVEVLYNTALEKKVDLVCGSYYCIFNSGEKKYFDGMLYPIFSNSIIDKVLFDHDKNKCMMMFASPHAKLYKTSLAKGIVFPHHVSYTDRLLYMIYLAKANNIVYIEEALAYYFVDRDGNTMTDTNSSMIDYHCIVFDSIWDQYESKISNKDCIFYYAMFLYANHILKELKKLDTYATFNNKRESVYKLFGLCQTKSKEIKEAIKLCSLNFGIKKYIVAFLLLSKFTMRPMFNYLSKRVFCNK